MVYDRTIDERTLSFEASGALKSASLVMRDRETDSWWSIMSSSAIGGALAGAGLTELPVGEKTTWRDWVRRHPDTVALSVDGDEHIDSNPYDNYFDSDGTFRDIGVGDERLEPKQPVFTFWLEGQPYAVPFPAFEGGRILRLDDGRSILLDRPAGASIFQSTRAFLLTQAVAARLTAAQVLDRIEELGAAVTPLAGFDTYWYTWVAVNRDTAVIE